MTTPVTCQPFQASRRRRGDLRTLRSAYEEWLTAHLAGRLGEFEPYRFARPIEERWTPLGHGAYDAKLIDPEDKPEPEPEPKPRRQVKQLAR